MKIKDYIQFLTFFLMPTIGLLGSCTEEEGDSPLHEGTVCQYVRERCT